MNVDQFIAAHANLPVVSDVELFDMFGLDMTESHYLKWNESGRVERVRVMDRASGQKTSERMLWHVGPVAKEKLATIQKREHADRLSQLASLYQNNSEYELPVDYPLEGATNLIKEGKLHPSHVLNDDGELD